MRVCSIVFLAFIAPVIGGYADQAPFGYKTSDSEKYYQFKHPIKRVAIIGAGVGGLTSYRELTQAGFEVHLYERDDSPGGNWHYTDEIPVDTAIPSGSIVVGDYEPSLPPKGATLPYVKEYRGNSDFLRRSHRAPKPIWESLTSNAPAPVQQIRETPWPAGTPWALPNQRLQRYLRAFASCHGVNNNDNNPNVSYNTRVELAEKRVNENGEEIGWTLTLKKLTPIGRDSVRATWTQENFDGLIVATGRYNTPNAPNIQGIKEWNDRFPGYITHSRQYRRPDPFTNQTVLIIGAATSGGEISRDIIKDVKRVYQSIRPQITAAPTWPLAAFLRRLPQNVTLISEIAQFHPPAPGATFSQGKVELKNGTIITGIDRIILATGYRYGYPFLPQYHNTALGINDTAPADETQPIVTDGTHLRSLYLDAFYIPDPTLTFINANFGMQSFTYAEFISLAIAKIWAGKADFPSTSELWHRYDALYKERNGYGRHFQFLGAVKTKENLRFLLGWLNDAAVKYGGRQIDSLPKDVEHVSAVWTEARFAAGTGVAVVNVVENLSLLGFGPEQLQALALDIPVNSSVRGTEAWAQDLVYNDYW